MSGKKAARIIQYIEELPAGTRISVRNLATELDVSEGTAYKAIKTAESLLLVETRPRAGTVRLGSRTKPPEQSHFGVCEEAEQCEDVRASNWMRIPPYLYHNDIAADWYSSYKQLCAASAKCAVVDDDLHICGAVDASRIPAASPSTRIATLSENAEQLLCADESTTMAELAERMIAENSSIAYITKNATLCGVITATDILKYYRLHSAPSLAGTYLPVLERISVSPQRSVYSVQLGSETTNSSDLLLSMVNIAARQYCSERTGRQNTFTNGTFYTYSGEVSGELMISCELQKALPSGSVIEVEIYNDATNFARCVYVVSDSFDETNRTEG